MSPTSKASDARREPAAAPGRDLLSPIVAAFLLRRGEDTIQAGARLAAGFDDHRVVGSLLVIRCSRRLKELTPACSQAGVLDSAVLLLLLLLMLQSAALMSTRGPVAAAVRASRGRIFGFALDFEVVINEARR